MLSKLYIGPHVKYSFFLSDLKELEISGQTAETCSNIKFHDSALNGSRVVPCGQTDRQTDGRTGRS